MGKIKTINQRREKPRGADNISALFLFARMCWLSPKSVYPTVHPGL